MTHEEIKQQHLTVMGPELGPLYHALHNDVLFLHEKWLEYRKLYGTKERVDLLNQTAGFFFGVIESVLWDDVLLHIARLTDRSKQGIYENLTLSRLPDAVPDELKSKIQSLVDRAKTQSEFARDWRNRRLAHTELYLAVDAKTARHLSDASRKAVDDLLASFSEILNVIHTRFLGGECGFRDVIVVADAETLLHHLKFGLQSEQQRMDRHMSGRAIPEDHEPFPSV